MHLRCESSFYYLILHYIRPHQDEEVEALPRAASRKRARSPASTGNNRRKVRRLSTAQVLSDVKNTIESAFESLTAAIREVATIPIPASIFSFAISTVAKDADFSQNDIDDAFEIFTNNPQVAKAYAAFNDTSARTRFLRRCLNDFQMKKIDGIGMN